MSLHGDLDSFYQQLVAAAARKKERADEHRIQRIEARHGRSTRGEHMHSPKLDQDVINLVIDAAVPEVFEIKILREPRGKITLLDGSKHGQFLVLDRLVTLMSLNKDCHLEVLRIVKKKMHLVVKLWDVVQSKTKYEYPLGSLVLTVPQKYGILSNAMTLQIQDRVLIDWDIYQRTVDTGAHGPTFSLTISNNPDPTSFAKRYLRRYMATFIRRKETAVFDFDDFTYQRYSLSHDLNSLSRIPSSTEHDIFRTIRDASWAYNRAFESTLVGHAARGEGNASGSIEELTTWAVRELLRHENYIYLGHVGGVDVIIVSQEATKDLIENTKDVGYWEEYELKKEEYAEVGK